jgi:hypothetical protein
MVLFEGAQHGLAEHREEADWITRDWLDRSSAIANHGRQSSRMAIEVPR